MQDDVPAAPIEGRALPSSALRWRCPTEGLEISSNPDEGPDEPLGQERALEAIATAVGISDGGYGVFIHGIPGTGRHRLVRRALDARAAQLPVPDDWCYVHNFQSERHPVALRLPAGRGRVLRDSLERFSEELEHHLPVVFEGEDYLTRRQSLQEGLEERQESAWKEIADDAATRGLAVIRSPMGLIFSPGKDGQPLSNEEGETLSDDEKKRLAAEVDALREDVGRVFRQQVRWKRELRHEIEELETRLLRQSAQLLLEEARASMEDLPEVLHHLDQIEEDVGRRGSLLAEATRRSVGDVEEGPESFPDLERFLRRYQVNLIVDHADAEGAPVVYADHPTLPGLLGRIDHRAHLGTLVTDFTLVRCGALHRANGGFLLLDADRLLVEPGARETLKRTLRARQIKIESLTETLGFPSSDGLEPEPIPLETCVLLIGDPMLYWAVSKWDPELRRLLKVGADVAPDLEKTDENVQRYARYLATILDEEGLRPFEPEALGRVIEESVRTTSDQRRLSLVIEPILDLLREADLAARTTDRKTVSLKEVEHALASRRHRTDRPIEQTLDALDRGLRLVDTGGEIVGQVNGLFVASTPDRMFGAPTRITARIRLGEGRLLDIEREVELGGPLHSKGVLILSGFLGGRYATEFPLALSASLVFEQSYSGVEGDSASLAELCALLSALSRAPIRQSVAITGSINQRGIVQAIGGVNDKIEGFFDLCDRRGLDGSHGVIIPASNVEHLMLRPEVVDAASLGKFHVWPVSTVDEALEILTGQISGSRVEDGDHDGEWTEGSLNDRVENRLRELAAVRATWQKSPDELLAEIEDSDSDDEESPS